MASLNPSKTVIVLDTEEDVAVELAKYTAGLSKKYIREKGSFSVVLSGGTLIDTLRKLVVSPHKESVDWSKWLIFWVDERVVPLDSDESNYSLATQGFLSKVPIPQGNIYHISDKNLSSPEATAVDYQNLLKKLVSKNILPLSNPNKDGLQFPIFDLMLLGMGPDGHVASLFPNRPQRWEKKTWVTYITDSPKPPPPRITFTFPVINSATDIAMVVTGADLAPATKIVLSEPHYIPPLPAAEVRPDGELTWFLDKAAASQLPNSLPVHYKE